MPLIDVNEAFGQATGWTAAEVLGAGVGILLFPQDGRGEVAASAPAMRAVKTG